MADKRKKKPVFKIRQREKGCPFCKDKSKPGWDNPERLRDFLTVRGRIMSRNFTAVCARHQKALTVAIKRARHLALLPFVESG